jgi:hypothetical protein
MYRLGDKSYNIYGSRGVGEEEILQPPLAERVPTSLVHTARDKCVMNTTPHGFKFSIRIGTPWRIPFHLLTVEDYLGEERVEGEREREPNNKGSGREDEGGTRGQRVL